MICDPNYIINPNETCETVDVREMIDLWYETLAYDELEKKMQDFLDSSGFLLFFRHDDAIYGAGEDGRIVFARIKHPNEEDPKEWGNQASFSALNLTRLVQGEPVQSMFGKKDLKGLKVIDSQEALELLMKTAKDQKISTFPVVSPQGEAGTPDNYIKTSEG